MEEGNLNKVLSMIKGIERKNSEFEDYLSHLKVLSRNKMLREISVNIIKNSKLFQELQVDSTRLCVAKEELENILLYNFIEELILKIKNDPTRKIIFLRDFLDHLEDVTQNDKIVILQSLEDKSIEELNQEMINLIKIFKIKDID